MCNYTQYSMYIFLIFSYNEYKIIYIYIIIIIINTYIIDNLLFNMIHDPFVGNM